MSPDARSDALRRLFRPHSAVSASQSLRARPVRSHRVLTTWAIGLAFLSALAACAQEADGGDARGPTASRDSASKALWAEMGEISNRPKIPLRAPANLAPTAGFAQADVDALTRRALDILRRSTNPRLSRVSATEAINRVYAGQYAPTTYEFKQDAIALTQGYDWQWFAASRFKKEAGTPSGPKVLKVAGAVSSGRDQMDTGEQASFLRVTIQAHIAQYVESEEFGRVPVIVRRTVRASGFRPRGGPDFWPSIITRTVPFGNTACGLYQGATLDPLTKAGDLRRDLASLKDSLNTRGVVPDAFEAGANPDELNTYVKKECNG